MTPSRGWEGVDLKELDEVVDHVLGMFPDCDDAFQGRSVPYQYIGSPHLDRVDRVAVSHKALGFDEERDLVSFFPGADPRDARLVLDHMNEVAAELKNSA